MPDIEFTMTGKAWHIGDFDDKFDEWLDLCLWCRDTDGMSATMSVQANVAETKFQVEGVSVPTVYPTVDSHVVWNGLAFTVLTPQEYAEKYG